MKLDHIVKFQSVYKLRWQPLAKLMDEGVQPILNMEFRETYPNLPEIMSGKYDQLLKDFGAKAKKDGRLLWVRPLHESNGGWYNWSVYFKANLRQDPEELKAAYRHVVRVLRETGGNFKFQFNLNRYNDNYNSMVPFSKFYPGDDVVDMFAITSYNRAGTTAQHPDWAAFHWDFDNAYQQAIRITDRPIAIAEIATTTHLGTDKPGWILGALKTIALRYPRVVEVTWFANNKVVNGIPWDWDLNTPEDIKAFADGVSFLRAERCLPVVGSNTGDPKEAGRPGRKEADPRQSP